jgi:hypothetical protein
MRNVYAIALALVLVACGPKSAPAPTPAPDPAPDTSAPCFKGGCSGQLCSDEEGLNSTCEFRPEYACYATATCARQPDGTCGWTPTEELTACLASPPAAE